MLTIIFVFIIQSYQKWISPLKPKVCRFHPSCSEYAKQVLIQKGFWGGAFYSFKRLGKCHPFHPGGYDPIP